MNFPAECDGLDWNQKLAYLVHKLKPVEDIGPEGCPVTHIFENGVYIREMRIPAGTLFIGRAHRHGHKCELVSGEVTVMSPLGQTRKVAGDTMMTVPGYHMVLRADTDVVGRTYHPNPTNSHDVAWLEANIFHSIEEMIALGAQIEGNLCLAQH